MVSVDIKTNYKPTETFQLIHNVPRATLRGGIKGETIRLLRTDSSKKKIEKESMCTQAIVEVNFDLIKQKQKLKRDY